MLPRIIKIQHSVTTILKEETLHSGPGKKKRELTRTLWKCNDNPFQTPFEGRFLPILGLASLLVPVKITCPCQGITEAPLYYCFTIDSKMRWKQQKGKGQTAKCFAPRHTALHHRRDLMPVSTETMIADPIRSDILASAVAYRPGDCERIIRKKRQDESCR